MRAITHDQIMEQGWNMDFSRFVTPGSIYYKRKYTLWWLPGDILLIRKGDNDRELYRGKINSLKQFRKLQKILKCYK